MRGDDVPAVPIVGIGASAGGLEALESFLAGVPADSGLAFVVVQHLDPTHDAILAELLQRKTRMPVVEAVDRMRVEREHVYVIPPNRDMTVLHGTLQLFAPSEPRGLRLPIDLFLRTLAQDLGEYGVAVILSGMGTDGTLGVRAVKEVGGIVLVQAPSDAKFDGMPRSAIDTGLADIVAPAAELGRRLVELRALPTPGAHAVTAAAERATPALEKVIVLLRARTRQDFSAYKKTTLYRRIERRMGIHQLPKIALYVRYLQANPQELDLLFRELLIGVTGFFRDPATWDFLRSQALPALFDTCPDRSIVRAWVPACSTGEEAYSLGMTFRETIDQFRPGKRLSFRIFATDLDSDAIARARQGLYPANIAADVSPERLARFFVSEETTAGGVRDVRYRIGREIREMVTLAPQNVLTDPPFTRLHVLSCRNLLIYLEPEAQAKLLRGFHYSLASGGILVLGNAESLGNAGDGFEPIDAKLRIFRRRGSSRPVSVADLPAAASDGLSAPTRQHTMPAPVASLQALADQVLLQRFSPAAVLVNAAGDILYISGRTGKFLEPAAGKANFNIFAMAREGLQGVLGRAIQEAGSGHSAVRLAGLRVKTNGDFQTVDLTVDPLEGPDELRGTFFVVFKELASPVAKAPRRRGPSASPAADGRDLELARLRAELRASREEMQTSQEELKSANEELQSANEELQSTNEELTTSKEEMQSLNEELQTVNAELRSKLDELLEASNDMRNLLDSTEIATLFLDRELNVRRFTPRATRVFKLIATDVGRPITDIVTSLEYSDLSADVEEVLRALLSIEKQVAARDGHWYSVRIMPYRTVDNVIDGVVVTFTDITKSKTLEAELRRLGAASPAGNESTS